MPLITTDKVLRFIGFDNMDFIISSVNDHLVFALDGVEQEITIQRGSYTGSELALTIEQNFTEVISTDAIKVEWNAASYKFDFETTSGRLIQYIGLNSTMGSTIGFLGDSSVSRTLSSDVPVGDDIQRIEMIRDFIESFAKSYCHKSFSVEQYRETHSASKNIVHLDYYPVTKIRKVMVGRQAAISVSNSFYNSCSTVSVIDNSIILAQDNDEVVININTDTTLSDVISSINATDGWTSSLLITKYAERLATELIPSGGMGTVNNHVAFLDVHGDPISEYNIDWEIGEIILPFCFNGSEIYVDYDAGISLPQDMELAILEMISFVYTQTKEHSFSLHSFTVDKVEKEFASMPKTAREVFEYYRGYKIW